MPDKGTALATLANDRLHEAMQKYPKRFAGLGTFAPQDPARSVKEIERVMTKLKLNGLIINSHTNGEFLSERKYWPILEALADLNAPLYIHPRSPNPLMAKAYRTDHLEHAIWGYAAETGLHGLRIITSGVLDQFPEACRLSSGTWARAFPTGFIGSITCTRSDRFTSSGRS